METFICSSCKEEKEQPINSCGTGYGIDKDSNKVCYSCCAEKEKVSMRKTGKATLYFDGKRVTDWAGRLTFKVLGNKVSRHNIARSRYDYWFIFEGFVWHGYTIGDNTQIAHCKRTKQVA